MSELAETRLHELQEIGFIESPLFDGKETKLKNFQIKSGELFLTLETRGGVDITEEMPVADCSDWIRKFTGIEKKPKANGEIKLKIDLPPEKKTIYNIQNLRKHLFDMVQQLENGTANADTAKAMASVAQTILNSAKIEMEYKQLIDKSKDKSILLFEQQND